MDQILKFLLENASFLYKKYNCKFVDSETSDFFDGDSYLTLRIDNLELRIISDRSQLFLDFRSILDGKNNEWFSVDLLQKLITNNWCEVSYLNSELTGFLEGRFSDICKLFRNDEVDETLIKLKSLEKERSKRMFG